jgi:hypothetical protein
MPRRSEEARQFLMDLNAERERSKRLALALQRSRRALTTLSRILESTIVEVERAFVEAEGRNV